MMTLLLPILLAYALVCVLAMLYQSRLVFFPDRDLVMTPDQIGLDYRDLSLTSDDGVQIHGWFIPGGSHRPADPLGGAGSRGSVESRGLAESERVPAGRVLLFLHGNAGNISHRLDSIRIFHELGLSVLIIDYRGYGRSSGRPSEAGTYLDAHAAWDYLIDTEGYDASDIVLFGRSLGGSVAINLAAKVRPAALIAESCFTSMVDVGARVYPWLPVRWIARIRYDSAARIEEVRCPKLIIHATDDEIVPFDLGRGLYDAAPQPKEFLELRGGHNEGFLISQEKYLDSLREFFDRLD